MRNKTKWLAVVLCLSLFASIAIGSGSSDSEATKEITSSDNSSNSSSSGSKEASVASDVASNNEATSNEAITIKEQVLVDQDGIKITATAYETDSIWGDGIKLLLENNTDKTVTIGCNALIVNDFMITDLFASEVAPGKKSNDIMYLSSSELEAAGIKSVGQVEVYFHIYDSDTWEDISNLDVVTIKTSEYENMDTTPNDAGFELYNSNGIKIVGKAVDENSFWGTAILLYIENNSGKNVGINVDNMSINGFMMTPYFSTTVYDKKKSVDDITILSSELEENSIESIEEVELKFHIYDADTYSTITDSDAISFSAK